MPQTTLGGAVSCRGVSLHSGHEVSMEFRPAPEHSGIVFHIHSEDGVHLLSPRPDAVSTTELATTISDGKASVSTIEHVLAALNGLAVDNVEVHIFGGETPILDGSARPVVEALRSVGFRTQNAPRRMARVLRGYALETDGRSISVEPFDGFRVDYTIRFPHPVIGEQHFVLDITPESFEREIAPARTFGFLKEVEYLHSRGLARGGSLENVIVIGDEGHLVQLCVSDLDVLVIDFHLVTAVIVVVEGALAAGGEVGEPYLVHLVAGHIVAVVVKVLVVQTSESTPRTSISSSPVT